MIFSTKNSAVLQIPENTLHCWQDMVAQGIYQRLRHTIVRDTFCCITLKARAQTVGQLYRDSSIQNCCVKVIYKCVVFKVSVGDLLHGTVEEINENGIRLSFESMRDLFVPLNDCPNLYGEVQDWSSKYKIGDLIYFRICYIRFDDSLTEMDGPIENGSWYRIYGKIV